MTDVLILPQPQPFAIPATYGLPGTAGVTGPAGDLAKATDRTALAAIAGAAAGAARYLAEAGREGLFVFSTAAGDATLATADTAQGVYVAGSGGTWVRKFSGALNVKWFGATGAGSGTPDATAVQAAINLSAALKNPVNTGYGTGAGPPVYLPTAKSSYYCGGSKLTIGHTLRFYGDDNGMPTASGSVLTWDGTTTGIEIGTTAEGALIEGLTLNGGFTTTEGEFHAIKRLTVSKVRDCNFREWPGDAINDDENVGGGSTNGSGIDRIYAENCRCAHKAFGADANAGCNIGIVTKANRQAGVYQGGFLGDHYYSCSMNGAAFTAWNTGAAGHPVSYCHSSGHWYAVMQGQETWCQTNAPSGTTASNQGWIYWQDGVAAPTTGVPTWFSGMICRAGGAYLHTNTNNGSTFVGCYAEDNNPSQFDTKAVLISPFMTGKWSVSGGVYYGEKDAVAGDKMRMVFAAGSTAFPAQLGQTRIQSTSGSATAMLWNSAAIASGVLTNLVFTQGLEADGVTPLSVARIGTYHTSTSPATAEGLMLFGTRTFGGTGAFTDWVQLDGSNKLWGPVTDNQMDLARTGNRWKTAFAYTGDFTTQVKINGVKVLGAQDAGWTADTGTAKKTATATYAVGSALTVGATYVQAEHTAIITRQALIEAAVRDATQEIKALKDALIAHGVIGT